MSSSSDPRIPWHVTGLWCLAALSGATGLVLAHGFDQPPVTDHVLRATLVGSLALFTLSRLLMVVPLRGAGARLGYRWVDYLLLIVGIAWWATDPSRERIIVRLGAAYAVLTLLGAIGSAGLNSFIAQRPGRIARSPVLWLFAAVFGLSLFGGILLCLPVCWAGPYPVIWDHSTTYAQLGNHVLDCCFTAVAAVTGTGLSACDVGYQFSRFGQLVILVLIQIGGLATLVLGSIAVWHLRTALGWHDRQTDPSVVGLRRMIRFACVAMLLLELAGAAALYRMWDPEIDGNYQAMTARPALLDDAVQSVPRVAEYYDEPRLFASVFHAVSGFSNAGITLTRNSLIPYRHHLTIYAALLPLMLLGALGGPVLYDLFRTITLRGGIGLRYGSRGTAITLYTALLLAILGGGMLWGIESSLRWQLRYPQEGTPGNPIEEPDSQAESTTLVDTTETARTQPVRMRTLSTDERVMAALFHSVSAWSGGWNTVRIDEDSLSPASRMLLVGVTLVGGGLGGTAGGLRITVVVLLLGAWLRRSRSDMLSPIAAVAVAMLTVIGVTTFVLVYRQAASTEACFIEAVAATCNGGLSTGLSSRLAQLSVRGGIAGQIALMLAMLLGKILPLGILLQQQRTEPRMED